MLTETIHLTVNGRPEAVSCDVRTTLLDLLREKLGLTGAKAGCNQGTCGACTVHVNGRRVLSCLVLAAAAQSIDVRTIEGLLREDGSLHPMQQAFIDHDAFQCGYCTPGQIMSTLGAIAAGDLRTPGDIPLAIDNICRCGAYDNIKAAIASVLKTLLATSGGAAG